MSSVSFVIKDVEVEGKPMVQYDVVPGEDVEMGQEITPALHLAGLMNFIVSKGYHSQFNKEFVEDAFPQIEDEKKGS